MADDWTHAWQEVTGIMPDEGVAWIRSRPPSIQAIMRIFPPLCLVRATRPLRCPAPGTVGYVYSYLEDGALYVVQSPESAIKAQCEQDWLSVVGYHHGMDRAWVAAILGDSGAN